MSTETTINHNHLCCACSRVHQTISNNFCFCSVDHQEGLCSECNASIKAERIESLTHSAVYAQVLGESVLRAFEDCDRVSIERHSADNWQVDLITEAGGFYIGTGSTISNAWADAIKHKDEQPCAR